ncbi:MAG: putative protein N(5)-glutamine methyltransferase [Actinotalea sp.]|nr:putative protein N(5)-glutamine methyltransferase [Actinotalea sp.]
MFAEDEAALLLEAATSPEGLDAMVSRRSAGEPIEHVVGWAAFCGLRILVDPGVFVPRRRTELLVREAVSLASDGSVVVDLCCGTGALGVAVAAALDGVELHAADVDPAAVRCARRNVEPVGGQVHLGDLDEPLPDALRGRVDLLLANVPYVPTEEIRLLPTEAREHEAAVALDGGSDGLDLLRRVAVVAPRWLGPGGHVLLEVSDRQAPAAVLAFARAGLVPRLVRDDDGGATVVVARLPRSGAVDGVESGDGAPTFL